MTGLDDDLRDRVAAAPFARLATVRPDGAPHLVPITFALDRDRLVTSVDHKPKSTTDLQRLRNIEAEPRVTVLVDHASEDWSQLWWARADGTATVVGADEAVDDVDRLVAKYPPYRRRRPAGPVIVVAVRSWTSWQA